MGIQIGFSGNKHRNIPTASAAEAVPKLIACLNYIEHMENSGQAFGLFEGVRPCYDPSRNVQSCDTMAITIQVIQTDFDNIQALICVLFNIFLIHPDLSSSVRTTSAVTPGLRSRLIMTFFAARIFKQDDNHLPPTPILDTVITQQRCPS
jgi:hypothetical protein